MREFRQKRQFREMVYSRPTLLVLLMVLFLTARAAYNVYGKESESRDRAARAQTELQNLQQRKVEVAKAIEELNTKEGMEREIRNSFRVAKPGEHLVVLVDPPKTEVDVPEDSLASGLWKKIKGLFGAE
ncbi:MAG: septum formation initiator family protein [Patescibacteria group bacterium]